MSLELHARVLKTQTDLSMRDKFILLGLAEHAWDDGTHCFPSRATLAAYAECTDRTVTSSLASLRLAGWIDVLHKATRYRPTEYRIRVERLSTLPAKGGKVASSRVEEAVSTEPSIEPSVKPLVAVPAPVALPAKIRTSEQAEMFAAIAEACGYDLRSMTPSERGRTAKAAKELVGIREKPAELRRFAADWKRAYPDAVLSPQAITNNWSTYCSGEMERLGKRRRA